jgi:large repetitive protein
VGGSGGASVTVHGRNLGGKGGCTVGARSGHTGCEASEWVSDSAVRCKIGQGAGGTRRGVVTAGERGGSGTEAWSYDAAGGMSRVAVSNVGGSGGASVTVHGRNLGGKGGYTVGARSGHTGCEASEWVSDSAVRCKIGQGAGGTRRGVVTAGERGGSGTEAWSYDAAGGMSRVAVFNVGGSGGASVTVHGRNLGGKGGCTVGARSGHTGCEASEWVSDSAVRCKIGQGAGGTRRGVVTAGERGGSGTEAWSYDAAGGMSRVAVFNVGGSGGASVTVHGRNLGGKGGYTVGARSGHTGCEASEWVSDSAVRCKIGQGAGGTRRGVVTAGERGGSGTEAWSYDAAGGMSRVAVSNVGGSGGALVTVHGRNLGGKGGYTVGARSGHTGCEASEWVSDSAVRCKIGQGAGGTRRGVVTAGERGGSGTEAWSYDAAGGMSRVAVSNVGGSGGASVTVHGRNLGGKGGYTVGARSGHTGCEASEWVSDSAVRCKIGQGAGGTRRGVVTAGERGGSGTEAWSYDAAGGMSRVAVSNVGGSGGASVTVHGRNLGGKGGYTVGARSGHTGCEASEWVSDSAVRCKIGQGAGGTRRGVVTAGERGGSGTEAWSYDAAGGMSRVAVSNVGGSGGASVTVHGRNLGGKGGYTVGARSGHTGCEASEWVSDSAVRCKIGQGAGGTRRGVVTAGERGGSGTEAWSYDAAGGMSRVAVSNVGGQGGHR